MVLLSFACNGSVAVKSLNLNVTVKIFEIYVHRNARLEGSRLEGSRLAIQGSKARGSRARGSKARRIEYSPDNQ